MLEISVLNGGGPADKVYEITDINVESIVILFYRVDIRIYDGTTRTDPLDSNRVPH
jgi:hypothetical protein